MRRKKRRSHSSYLPRFKKISSEMFRRWFLSRICFVRISSVQGRTLHHHHQTYLSLNIYIYRDSQLKRYYPNLKKKRTAILFALNCERLYTFHFEKKNSRKEGRKEGRKEFSEIFFSSIFIKSFFYEKNNILFLNKTLIKS